jgi:hypothetical protein
VKIKGFDFGAHHSTLRLSRLTRLVHRGLALALVMAVALPAVGPAAALPASAQTATSASGGPPANDPAGPPTQYTLARSDQLFVTKTQQWPGVQGTAAFDSTYSVKPDLSGLASSTTYAATGMPATDSSWPLLPVRGRFTDSLHEQVLLLDQSSNCSGAESCTYTQLLGSPASAANSVPSWLNLVSAQAGGNPVAVAAGDLDGRINAQGFANDEAAVAYRGADGTLQVHVIDYNVAPGQVVDTSPTVALPSIGTPAAGPGSVAVAVGDFDSDGQNEVAVLWQGGGCSGTTPQCTSAPHLTMLRYTNDGQTQTVAVLQADVPLPADLMTGSAANNMGFQASVGNFDGQGADELAFSFIRQDAELAVLGFAPMDESFTVSRYGHNPGGTGDFAGNSYCPDSGCNPIAVGAPPKLAAGLFWYDEPSGYGLGRRQLAMAALNQWQAGTRGEVAVQMYDVAFDPSTCAQNPCALTLTEMLGPDQSSQGAGPPWQLTNEFLDTPSSPFSPTISLTAGSFQGLTLNPKDQTQIPWALAIGLSGQVTAPDQNESWVFFYRPSGTQPGQFQLNELFQPDSDQAATSPRVLAYDSTGASLVLGAPMVFQFNDHQVPSSILQDPPKHLDWLYDPVQKLGSFLNVDRSESLNLTVTDSTTSTYESQTTTGSDWTIGSSVTANVTASTEAGLGKIANAGGGLDVSAEVGGQYDHNQSSYNSGGSSYSLGISGATNDDDLLVGSQRSWSVYRYPIIGRTLTDAQGKLVLGPNGQPQYGFYEITLPGQTVPFGPGGGRAFGDWYQPLHENGNALSYPALGPNGLVSLDPSQLGPSVTMTGSDSNGSQAPVTVPQPLINKSYIVDQTGSSVNLAISQVTGSGNSSSTTGTLSESLDIDAGASSEIHAGVGQVEACADVDLKFNNSNSWSSLKTSSTTTTSTNTFTLQQDAAAQPNWGYGAATAYYTDAAGVYRASHAVNLLASTDSAPEWKQYYGGRPDPALNLPDKMVLTYNQKDKTNDIPNFNNADSRQLIRGFFVLHPDADHGGPSGSLQAGAPASYPSDGDTVQLQVIVHNYSLDTAATNVPVRFLAVPRDALDEHNVGAPIELGTVTLGTVAPLGWQPANLLWDTTGRAATGAELYRIFVVVAGNDPSKGAADPWNGVVHAWQDRYNQPVTVDGTPDTARLVDPLTGQAETLEAGQNKQGWGEVTIYPKTPAPAPLAATAAPVQSTPVQFGSGGLRVTAPHLLGAEASGSAATTDQVHEVRANVAATPKGAALLGNSYCHGKDSATLQVYEGDPAHGGQLVGMKTVHGLASSGSDGRWLTLPWTPRSPGRHQLVARLFGGSMEQNATPVETTLDVDVAPAAEPPASLERLQSVLRVVWLPAELRAALGDHLQAANTAVANGDQAGARAALSALEQEADAARTTSVSGHSALRLDSVVDALLAQPTIAAASTLTADAAGTPTADATSTATVDATRTPTADPTADPTTKPTAEATGTAAADPTTKPTAEATGTATADPTTKPTAEATGTAAADPTRLPAHTPTAAASAR